MDLIKYPKKDKNEAEIQALLWYFLRKRKVDARLEVAANIPDSKKHNKLDIVIFVGKEPKCIIECKSWQSGYALTAQYRRNNTKQLTKYRTTYNLPVLVCARVNHIDGTIERIYELLHAPG